VAPARFFRTTYKHQLVQEWLPALDDVSASLSAVPRSRISAAGHGISTILMAKSVSDSRFFGFDAHPGSIDTARGSAMREGLRERVSFDVATAKTVPANGYDLVCFFDCLHDMGDPVGALRHVRETMADDGTCMLVEPFANDRLENNFTPVGRCSRGIDHGLHACPRWRRRSVLRWARKPAKRGCAR